MSDSFWLLDWMDFHGATSASDIKLLTSQSNFLTDMYDRASAASLKVGQTPNSSIPVLAGRGLDLSGEMVGADTDELIAEVNDVFGTLWHYFDEIVVEGFAPRRFMLMCQNRDVALARIRVEEHCRLLLHLRSIGALDCVVFRQKPDPCVHHGDHGAILEEAGLGRILAEASELTSQFTGGLLGNYVGHFDHFHYEYHHELLGDRSGTVWRECSNDPTESQIIGWIAQHFFELYAEYVAADVAAAQELNIPLAVSPFLRDTIVDRLQLRPNVGELQNEVAVEIGLPILSGINAKDLIKIRADEAEAFERFRSGLRGAIREQLKSIASTDQLPTKISADLIDEYISPGISDIAQRLTVAQRTLARKSATNISIGSVSVLVGLIAAMPLLAPAGIALGLAAPGVHYAKYLDEKATIELSDMYFLWKLQKGIRA